MKYSTPALIIILFTGFLSPFISAQDVNQNNNFWRDQMIIIRKALAQLESAKSRPPKDLVKRLEQVEADSPVEWDWLLQDCQGNMTLWFAGVKDSQPERKIIQKVIRELGVERGKYQSRLQILMQENISYQDSRWLSLYHQACEQRRARRLQPLLAKWRRMVFTKHFNLGGSHYAYTEAQSDAQHERNFKPGSALCILKMDGLYGKVHTLLEDRKGVIRDPDVSYDGKRILFAWKKSDRQDDYHLYEMDVATRKVRQITDGLGFADYEGAYLPNDEIIFNSTRCVQIVDCWWTEVSNLYTCDKDGQYLRRLSFDQVHTNFPTVLEDGRVIYTRWDYNDRAQIYPQPLFVMNYDGTASWDVKVVLGDAKVHEDGSALFTVPARTPVYFQALDVKGHMVQTMRSWSTLQPNEKFSCVGCHEDKNGAPPNLKTQTQALQADPESLQPFYGPPRGFSFIKEIQPILDRHCIRCHNDRRALQKRLPNVAINLKTTSETKGSKQASDQKAFSLLGVQNEDFLAKRKWGDSYLALTQAYSKGKNRNGSYYSGNQDGKIVNWINVMSEPTMLPPYYKGSSSSKLITMLAEGHKDVTLCREEMDKLACWIDLAVPYGGDYTEANLWTPQEIKKYQRYADKRKRMEKREKTNIEEYIQQQKQFEITLHQ